jgi:translation initiation factor 1
MTVVTGLPGPEADLDALLRGLKASLGTGGTREGRTLAFQGDQRERLLAALTALGHRPKLAGG